MPNYPRNEPTWKRPQQPVPMEAGPESQVSPVRSNRLRLLLSKLDRAEVSERLGMTLPKLAALEEGRLPVGPEQAYFIETEVGLPGGWLDGRNDVDFATFVPAYKVETPAAPAAPAPVPAPVIVTLAAPAVAQPVPEAGISSPVPVSPPTLVVPEQVTTTGVLTAAAGRDTDQTRVENLRRLTRPRGFKSALAKVTGLQDSYVSRLLAVGTKGFRALSDKQARRVEQAALLPVGWLDSPGLPIPDATRDEMGRHVTRGERKTPVRGNRPAAAEHSTAKRALPRQQVSPPVAEALPPVKAAIQEVALPKPAPTITREPEINAERVEPVASLAYAKKTISPLAAALLAMLGQRAEEGTLSDETAYALLGTLLRGQ